MHLVGDGPQHDELRNHSKKLGIEDYLVWHSRVDKGSLREIYRSADCFVNPSLYEGMPNVVLEAMSCGPPVIASHVLGNDVVVRHGETGWLFDLSKPDTLRTALRVMVEDPGQARRMGQKGRAWVLEAFSWRRVAEAYADLFSEPAGRAPHGCLGSGADQPPVSLFLQGITKGYAKLSRCVKDEFDRKTPAMVYFSTQPRRQAAA